MKARRTREANASERTYGPVSGTTHAQSQRQTGHRPVGTGASLLPRIGYFSFCHRQVTDADISREIGKRAAYFGARDATILSKRGSPRSGSQNGSSFSLPELTVHGGRTQV